MIKQGVELNWQDCANNTALHKAAQHGYEEIVQILLDAGAIADESNDLGCTPLHYAALSGYNNMIKTIVAKGVNINAPDWASNTPLHLAAVTGNEEAVTILLEAGAIVDLKTTSNKTSEQLAQSNGHIKIAGFIRSWPALQNTRRLATLALLSDQTPSEKATGIFTKSL